MLTVTIHKPHQRLPEVSIHLSSRHEAWELLANLNTLHYIAEGESAPGTRELEKQLREALTVWVERRSWGGGE